MPEPLLSLKGVHTHIGQYHILQGVDLDVPAGGVALLLGRNGAGKTTTMRTIMGLWRASAGSITFDGRDITMLPTPDIARLGIAYVPENMAIFANLTVRENLLLAAVSRADGRHAARLDFRRLPAAQDLLGAAGRQPLRRAEADARGGARGDRAAPPAPDRRAEQGPGAGDRGVAGQRARAS